MAIWNNRDEAFWDYANFMERYTGESMDGRAPLKPDPDEDQTQEQTE